MCRRRTGGSHGRSHPVQPHLRRAPLRLVQPSAGSALPAAPPPPPNPALPQAYDNKEAGIRRLTTETGAGQWGSALSMASKFFGLECLVFMVRASYEQKPYRRILMETYGAEVRPSPSPTTGAGKRI